MTGLQFYNNGAVTVANNANILFTTTALSTDANITYNSGTGVATFANAGVYYVNWSASVATVAVSAGAVISLVTSAQTFNSGTDIKNGIVAGTTILNATAGLTLALQNKSGGTIKLASDIPTNAALSIVNAESSVTDQGFSAFISNVAVSANAQLANWSNAAPYFGSAAFNATTGNYTVPETGRYLVTATINYSTTAAITATLGNGVNPAFAVTRTSPTSTTLINALLPILNINVTLLSLRTILGSGSVNLCGEVQLNAGDVVGLFYQSSGLALTLNLGNSNGVFWSVQQIA